MPQRVPSDIAAHYERVQDYKGDALADALSAWQEVNPGRISESWRQVLPIVAASVTSSQISAAESALVADGDMAVVTGQYRLSSSFTDPESTAGTDSYGGSLEGALYAPAIRTKQAIGTGVALRQAMRVGAQHLERIVSSVVSDSGRQAATASHPTRFTGGYVRMLNPPSCARCVILAGRWYRWNAGFRRHP